MFDLDRVQNDKSFSVLVNSFKIQQRKKLRYKSVKLLTGPSSNPCHSSISNRPALYPAMLNPSQHH
jgi:hypothetical protein